MRLLLTVLLFTVSTLPLWAADEKPATRATASVSITDLNFNDATLTVNAGDTVTWSNAGSTAHTVTSDVAGIFDSGNIAPGQTFSFTFANAGSFPYHCTIHPELKGTVSVNAVGGGTIGGSNISGTWTGKFKSKKFKQTGGEVKSTNISGTLTATLTHVVSDVTGTLAFTSTDGSPSYSVSGKVGNTHFWMSGADSSGDEQIVISAHVSKKGDSFKGTGIIYEKEEQHEISFTLKKQ